MSEGQGTPEEQVAELEDQVAQLTAERDQLGDRNRLLEAALGASLSLLETVSDCAEESAEAQPS